MAKKEDHLRRTAIFTAIFLLVPLLTSIGAGLEMRANRMEHIPLAILDQDSSEFSRTIISYLLESEILDFYAYATSAAEMETWFQQGKIAAGVIIPPDLAADMVQGNGPQILLLYDGTGMMVAGAAKQAMGEVILTMKSSYLKSFYEGRLSVIPEQALKNALPIDVTYRNLYNPAKNFSNYLLLGLLTGLLQLVLVMSGVEYSRLGKQTFTSLLNKCLLLGAVGTLVIVVCLGIQYLWFDLPYSGNLAAGATITYLFALCLVALGILIGQIVSNRLFASQVAAFLVLPTTILGGYTFPTLAMPSFFQQLAKGLPFTHYSEALQGLCFKGFSWQHAVSALEALALLLSVILFLLAMVLALKKWAERKFGATGGSLL